MENEQTEVDQLLTNEWLDVKDEGLIELAKKGDGESILILQQIEEKTELKKLRKQLFNI